MDKILILDFGSQYTQLIARRIRELNIYSEIHPYDVDIKTLKEFSPKAIILSGGPNSVYEDDTPKAPKEIFELNIPILGICYGMQTLINQFGGKVETSSKREFGYAEIRAHGHSKLFKDIQDKSNDEGHGLLDVWMSHGDKVTDIPQNFKVIASNASTPIAAIADEEKLLYGVQFHPEVTHTKQGKAILKRFSLEIAQCSPSWNMPDYVNTAVNSIKEQVQSDHVILGLSGGVDSSVAAALIHKAIGNQLTCIFVDHGLLRLDEGKKVMETFNKNLGVKVIHVDASKKFMDDLKGISDPEEKRKIIGKDFVDIFQEEAKKIDNA
ncbi:MAG: glutamine-hydrolyzing GMP synthase, partial [Methylophilaceae bacterium]